MSTKEMKALTKVVTQQSAEISELKNQVAELVKLLTKEPVSKGSSKKVSGTTGTVIVKNYKKSLLVTGETKPVKDTLKELNGKWNGTLVGWIFPVSKEDDIMEALADIVGNLVREGSEEVTEKVPVKKVTKKKAPEPVEDSDSESESESESDGSESESESDGSESESDSDGSDGSDESESDSDSDGSDSDSSDSGSDSDE